jgi:pimeloyl-ACP methyl ester carboxylesterase
MTVGEVVRPPSLALLAAEGRAIWEAGLFLQALPMLRRAPRGDGHPVLVLPGFTASDLSTQLLRAFLRERGYQARGWALGRNRGYSGQLELRMARRLQNLHWKTGRKVSIVGWSLGGIFARELARQHPDMVRLVVTLGSPFSASPRATNVWRLYEMVSGQRIEDIDPELVARMRQPPPVPSTAVYTRGDGITAWQACLEPSASRTENVRVPGSHCGLGHNPWAAWVIADRLSQAEDTWQPFDPGPAAWLFPR